MSEDNSVLFPGANPQANVSPAESPTTSAVTSAQETVLPTPEIKTETTIPVTPIVSAPAETVTTTIQTSSPAPVKKKSKAGCIIALVIFLFLFLTLGAGTTFAYFSNNNIPVFSDIVEFGEKLVLDAKSQQTRVKTGLFGTVGDVSGNNSTIGTLLSDSNIKNEIAKNLAADRTKVTSAKFEAGILMSVTPGAQTKESTSMFPSQTDISFNIDGSSSDLNDKNQANINFDFGLKAEGNTMDGAAELRMVNKSIFLKLTTVPSLLTSYVDLTDIKGRWLEMSEEDLASLGSTVTATTEVTTTTGEADAITKFLDLDAIKNNISRLKDEVIGGVRTNCYSLDLDNKDYTELLKQTNALEEKESQMSEATIIESSKSIDNISMSLCLGRRDNLLYRFGATINGSTTSLNPTTDLYEADGKASLTITAKIWDYNVPVTIETPTDTVDFKEAIQQIMAPLIQQTTLEEGFEYDGADSTPGYAMEFASARDQQRESDVNTIQGAILQYLADGNSLTSLGVISTCPNFKTIGTMNTSGYIDLSPLLSDYLYELPYDPQTGSEQDTKYTICKESTGRITVGASESEIDPISVTR